MGAIHFSIDPDLAALLVRGLGLLVFVETGTFKGGFARPNAPLVQGASQL